jgi:hypothetical protein
MGRYVFVCSGLLLLLPTSFGGEAPQLNLMLALKRPAFLLGEPVVLQAVVRNVGSTEFRA